MKNILSMDLIVVLSTYAMYVVERGILEILSRIVVGRTGRGGDDLLCQMCTSISSMEIDRKDVVGIKY